LNFQHQDINKESLGYLIPNNLIRKYLYKRVKNISNVTLINGLECVSIDNNEKYSSLFLSNKRKIKSSLVVAADSRFSKRDRIWVFLRLFTILIKI
jgi:2-polyprenyl-6-methoxyphenol hydroxylase-like FAD-dependent oxidoreductase